MSALPGISDINLFCYGQGIVYFDPDRRRGRQRRFGLSAVLVGI